MVKNKNKPDYILFFTIVFLIVLGILILASASAAFSQERFGNPYHILKNQIIWGFIPGIILGFIAFKIRLDIIKKWAPFLFLFFLILTAMVFLPKIGLELGGARRWLYFGGISFQPSEFLKLGFILYLAFWLSSRNKEKKDFSQTFIAFLIIISLIGLILINQPNVSTLGVLIAVGVLMYFLANTPLWHTASMFLVGIIGLYILIKTAPYRMRRWITFLNPETDPLGLSYHLQQALIAVGSGGIFGLGLGMSLQKFGFLPHSISDSIFAIFAEETGFIGAIILIFLFLLIFWRIFKISKNTKDKFSELCVLGIGSWFIIQSFVNIGTMIGILPLTGIPLPFISHGGSHIIAELIGVGILLNISKSST